MDINKDTPINEVDLASTIASIHHMTLDEFIIDEVLTNYKNAKSLIMVVAPLVLRININSLMFDADDINVYLLLNVVGKNGDHGVPFKNT